MFIAKKSSGTLPKISVVGIFTCQTTCSERSHKRPLRSCILHLRLGDSNTFYHCLVHSSYLLGSRQCRVLGLIEQPYSNDVGRNCSTAPLISATRVQDPFISLLDVDPEILLYMTLDDIISYFLARERLPGLVLVEFCYCFLLPSLTQILRVVQPPASRFLHRLLACT